MLDVLAKQDLFEFVDGDPGLKGIMQKVIDGTPIKKNVVRTFRSMQR